MKKLTLISALIVFAGIALLPIFWIIADSLVHNGGFSLESHKNVLADERQQNLFKNTMVLGINTAFFSLLVGAPLGFLIARTNLHLKTCFKYLYFVPLIIPPHVHAIAWIYLLGTKGRLNLIFEKLFSPDGPVFTIYGLKGAILVLTLSYFPLVTILTIGGLGSMDRRLEEAGMISAGRFHVFRKITLPLAMPHIITGAILVFMLSVSNYGVPSLLRLNTYPIEIFARFSAFYDTKGAVALSMPLVTVISVLVALQHWHMKGRPFITIGTGAEVPRLSDLKNWRIPAFGFAVLVILISVVIPMATLVMESGSLAVLHTALKTAHGQIANSLVLSLTAATFAVGLHFFVAYALERTGWRGMRMVDFLSFVPFAVPGAILGMGMIRVWNRPEANLVYESFAIVIFAHVARFGPFAIRSVSASLGKIDTNLEEAAVLANASWPARVWKILIPLSKPGLMAGWIMTFIFCMGELGTTLLIIPPGKETLSIRIYSLTHYGAGNLVACLCLVLVVITMIPVSILMFLNSRGKTAKSGTRP